MGRPAAIASKTFNGDVWRSVMPARRKGATTTAARPSASATRACGTGPGISVRAPRPRASTKERMRRVSASPSMPPRITRRAPGTAAMASTSTSTPFQG